MEQNIAIEFTSEEKVILLNALTFMKSKTAASYADIRSTGLNIDTLYFNRIKQIDTIFQKIAWVEHPLPSTGLKNS